MLTEATENGTTLPKGSTEAPVIFVRSMRVILSFSLLFARRSRVVPFIELSIGFFRSMSLAFVRYVPRRYAERLILQDHGNEIEIERVNDMAVLRSHPVYVPLVRYPRI